MYRISNKKLDIHCYAILMPAVIRQNVLKIISKVLPRTFLEIVPTIFNAGNCRWQSLGLSALLLHQKICLVMVTK